MVMYTELMNDNAAICLASEKSKAFLHWCRCDLIHSSIVCVHATTVIPSEAYHIQF